MTRPNEFTRATREAALERQGGRCGSCRTKIQALGCAGRAVHDFGESAEAHHLVPIAKRGDASLANCVVLCRSCHYSAHEGGRYSQGTVLGRPRDFSFYRKRVK
ncbi:MAG: HNH endonuclease [Planctomycetota bacterium]